MTIHWCGTGLSSGPGLRRLLTNGHKVVVWNRTVGKARETVGNLTQDIRAFTLVAWIGSHAETDLAKSMGPPYTEGTSALCEAYLSTVA